MDFSEQELAVLGDQRFFILKKAVTDKLDRLFADNKERWSDVIQTWNLPPLRIDTTRGKIFRGENYRGFPYTLMDFPRHFSQEYVFALRTMCWWGHEFSLTLHVQGSAFDFYKDRLEDRLNRLMKSGILYCVADQPWEYHLETSNYQPLEELSLKAAIQKSEELRFIKLARTWPLDQVEGFDTFSLETVRVLGEFLK